MEPLKYETDAKTSVIDGEESDSVKIVSRSETSDLANLTQNNLLYKNVNNSTVNLNINNSHGFHMGNVFNIGMPAALQQQLTSNKLEVCLMKICMIIFRLLTLSVDLGRSSV